MNVQNKKVKNQKRYERRTRIRQEKRAQTLQKEEHKEEEHKEENKMYPVGSIIRVEGIETIYVVLDTYQHLAKNMLIQEGDMFDWGDEMYAPIMYDPDSDYYIVRCVFLYQNEYFHVPSSVSYRGTLSVHRKVEKVDYVRKFRKIKTLSVEVCEKVCPGYLDA